MKLGHGICQLVKEVLQGFTCGQKKAEEAETYITKLGDPKPAKEDQHKRVSYIIKSDSKVVMHFGGTALESYIIRIMGVQKGQPVTIGFCLPKGAENEDPGVFLNFDNEGKKGGWRDDADVMVADSFEDLEQDDTGKNVYVDKESRILFVKFSETRERDMETDFADCPGGNLVSNNCPWVNFNFRRIPDHEAKLDFSMGECVLNDKKYRVL